VEKKKNFKNKELQFLSLVSWQCCGSPEFNQDTAFNINADPDLGSQTNADPDPGHSGQTLMSQKVEFLHEKLSRY
jgi:hypothetical protein